MTNKAKMISSMIVCLGVGLGANAALYEQDFSVNHGAEKANEDLPTSVLTQNISHGPMLKACGSQSPI